MFVTVEGIEGCGKSTLLSGLAERLREEGRELAVTREPGGTPLGDAIRAIFLNPALQPVPLAEVMLVNASRAQHVVDVIAPALRRGAVVLCDRFVDSTLAYQGYGRGIDVAFLRAQCDVATGGLQPDLTFVLDVPVAVSRERIAGRRAQHDRMELQDNAFHERVRHGFLDLARAGGRYRVFDATMSVPELASQAYAVLTEALVR